MLDKGDIVKLYKDDSGKFFHNFTALENASQFELLQLEKVTLDLKNRLSIALAMRIQNEGDKTQEA